MNRAKELKKKNNKLEQLNCLLEDETISTFEDGKYVDDVCKVIINLLAMNVSKSKFNEVIPTDLKKLAGNSISRLPSMTVHSRLLVEAKHLADVQLGRAILEEADPFQVVGNTLHGDGTTKYHRHYQDFELTTPSCQTYSMGLCNPGWVPRKKTENFPAMEREAVRETESKRGSREEVATAKAKSSKQHHRVEGPWKPGKEINDGLMKTVSEKERQKVLAIQLQFQKVAIQAKAPTMEHFQQ